jgi:hypothetical protein
MTPITVRAIGRFKANRPAYSQMATLFSVTGEQDVLPSLA